MASILKKWGYLHNERVFSYKVFAVFITHQNLSFGGFALKVEFVVLVYELFIYEILAQVTYNRGVNHLLEILLRPLVKFEM